MPKKGQGKANKISDLTRYLGKTGLYVLSRKVKREGVEFKHVIISEGRGVSGKGRINVFPADEDGRALSTKPTFSVADGTPTSVLNALGFDLV